ncbi:hypothetical protein SapgrDRAFT_1761 [Saprospira grandis DSM 2844]|uniref:N-acetyltransferase domain-containing protein n=1 Tax=Saprospira grandis DSM 2844 TaxID=694433 RepID=J1I3Z7_9BACT|nr:hypothetical protein [Saprospira grandis]EJF53465.1 hypothetical protein SapgrDRAFT_1761 [Saprospira grandis DSM 2844]
MFFHPPYLSYRIKQFNAIAEPELSRDYHQKHLEVLAAFGVGPLGSTLSPWYNQPAVTVFAVYDEFDEILAGIRLERLEQQPYELPLSHAICVDSPDLLPKICRHKGQLAEICGAWVAPRARKCGLLQHLIGLCIDLGKKMQLDYLLAMPPEHTKAIFTEYSFSPVPNAFGRSEYCYPDDRYTSTLMELGLSLQLAQASPATCN